jgi:hypothetical protein
MGRHRAGNISSIEVCKSARFSLLIHLLTNCANSETFDYHFSEAHC